MVLRVLHVESGLSTAVFVVAVASMNATLRHWLLTTNLCFKLFCMFAQCTYSNFELMTGNDNTLQLIS